jgi:hypothetical protein
MTKKNKKIKKPKGKGHEPSFSSSAKDKKTMSL